LAAADRADNADSPDLGGLGWFQYRQIDRVTIAAVQGSDNFVWDFIKIDLQMARYQLVLRDAMDQPGNTQRLTDVSNEYNILASQTLAIQAGNSGETMRQHAAFQQTMTASQSYMEGADPSLESVPKSMSTAELQSLLNSSQVPRASTHKLVQDAHLLQNSRSIRTLEDIR
jgi:hypothetical protein